MNSPAAEKDVSTRAKYTSFALGNSVLIVTGALVGVQLPLDPVVGTCLIRDTSCFSLRCAR